MKRVVIGCDLTGFSTLSSGDQVLVAAHLWGCHLKAEAYLQIRATGHNNTGDGFWVTYDAVDDDNTVKYLRYVQLLGMFYQSDDTARIARITRKRPVKVVAHYGSVYIDSRSMLTGDGINDAARMLGHARTEVPLISETFGALFGGIAGTTVSVSRDPIGQRYWEIDSDHDLKPMLLYQDPPIRIITKHQAQIAVTPLYFDRSPEENPECRLRCNRFVLLKHDGFPHVIERWDGDLWNHIDNLIAILADRSRAMPDANSCFTVGHTLVGVDSALVCFLEVLRRMKDEELLSVGPFRMVMLSPESAFAKSTSDENGESFRTKLRRTIRKVIDVIDENRGSLPISAIEDHCHFYMTEEREPIGCIRVADIMFIVHYQGQQMVWKDARVEFYSSFDNPEQFETWNRTFRTFFASADRFQKVDLTKLRELVSGS
jgi:hypothetical protein